MSAQPLSTRPGSRSCALRVLAAGVLTAVLFGRVEAGDLAIVVSDAAGNRLPDAVVLADALDAPAGEVTAEATERPSATVSQIGKQFEPYVSAIRVGTTVNFPNRDDILHNVYSFSKAKPFQLPLYKDKPPKPVIFDKPGVVILGCNIHDWMVAYVYVADTPHFTKTGGDGRAVLTELPLGSYLIRVWHPRKKRRGSSSDRRIRITTASPEPIEFTVALKPEWRPRRPPQQE